jgi:8-oxo-dGTP diphosphatase
MSRQIAIGIIVNGDQVLVGRRSADQVLAGYDEFPGGKLHASESPEQAVVRECREETGLAVVVASFIRSVRHHYDHGDVELFFYRCSLAATCENDPLPPFGWVDISRLEDCRFPEANTAVVRNLIDDC